MRLGVREMRTRFSFIFKWEEEPQRNQGAL